MGVVCVGRTSIIRAVAGSCLPPIESSCRDTPPIALGIVAAIPEIQQMTATPRLSSPLWCARRSFRRSRWRHCANCHTSGMGALELVITRVDFIFGGGGATHNRRPSAAMSRVDECVLLRLGCTGPAAAPCSTRPCRHIGIRLIGCS